MKKFMFFVLAMLLAVSASAQFKVGGGLTIGTESAVDDGGEKMGIGLTLKGVYSLNEEWAISPDFTYYFPSGGDNFDFNLWQINANAHYFFHDLESMRLYGLAGLNYSSWKWSFDGDEYIDWGGSDDSEIGLNLGIGALMDQFYGELKYDTALEQIAISAGIMF